MGELDSLKGSILVGSLWNYAFMGILAVQAYVYYITFPKDKLYLKILVFLILAIDLVQTIISTHSAWYILVSELPGAYTWSFGALTALTGLVTFVVQSFLTWRICVIGGPRKIIIPVVGVIIITAVASCALSLMFGLTIGIAKLREKGQPGSIGGCLVAGLICDVLVTGTLALQLRSRKNPEFTSTTHVLHRAIRLALETGVVTCILAVTALVLFFVPSTSYQSTTLLIINGKVYSNSLLASLNSRAPVFRRSDPGDEQVREVDHTSGVGADKALPFTRNDLEFKQSVVSD